MLGPDARHEREDEHGISHLMEHMAFKGTERRSASDIAEEIEAVGGELNAATSLETTAYYARILKADVAVAIDILADILQRPRYAESDLEGQAAFREGRQKLGCTESRNIRIDTRWAVADVELMQRFAREIAELQLDLILSGH